MGSEVLFPFVVRKDHSVADRRTREREGKITSFILFAPMRRLPSYFRCSALENRFSSSAGT